MGLRAFEAREGRAPLPQLDPFASVKPFERAIAEANLALERRPMKTLQVNIGKLCNQACLHCHVEAGPKRTENMSLKTVERLLQLLEQAPSIDTVDITGGAPELNPNFRFFVREIRRMKKEVIDRCNLTVLSVPGQEDTAEFLRDHQVKVTASLPCYSSQNVEKQRGNGVFQKSITALQTLNKLGYGGPNELELNLVYNPVGAFLPPDQTKLESDYRQRLKEDFGIQFTQLFTITNMPIKRFLRDLERSGKLEEYMELLVQSFNPTAAGEVMCRDLVSIGWDGQIYDCDFNQMLDIPVGWKARSVFDIDNLNELNSGAIAFKPHCYGCTAGAGSSCGGKLA